MNDWLEIAGQVFTGRFWRQIVTEPFRAVAQHPYLAAGSGLAAGGLALAVGLPFVAAAPVAAGGLALGGAAAAPAAPAIPVAVAPAVGIGARIAGVIKWGGIIGALEMFDDEAVALVQSAFGLAGQAIETYEAIRVAEIQAGAPAAPAPGQQQQQQQAPAQAAGAFSNPYLWR